MPTRRDVFRPHREPARSLYDAFVAAAAHRAARTPEESERAEVDAVLAAATKTFPAHGLSVPSRADVEDGRRYAQGAFDFGLTWVARIVNGARRSGSPDGS